MPQPLNRFPKPGNITIGNNTSSPARHRPQLALLAMNVIAEWSILESFMLGLFLQMLGTSARIGAAMYESLTSDNARQAALRGLAEVVLSEQENLFFEAILEFYKTCSKDRNKYAHWIWGAASNLPDAVLLQDPMANLAEHVKTAEHTAETDKFLQHMYAQHAAGKQITMTPPKPMSFQSLEERASKVFVYTERDFTKASERIQRLIGFVAKLRIILNRSHMANEGGTLWNQLSSEPELCTIVYRLQKRRKNAPSVPIQWPVQVPPWES